MKTALPYLVATVGLGVGVTLVACGSDGDTINNYYTDGGTITLSDGAVVSASKVLTSSKTVASDTTCPSGGVILSFGVDTNGNGVLDPSEVTSTQEVCTDTAAKVITTVVTTGPDEKCASGGTIIESGTDTNGNGVLDPSEVTASSEICNGGSADGVLTKTIVLPIGDPNCPLGGTETETGVDNGDGDGGVAGDGILEPGEVTSTTFQCSNGQTDAGSGSLAPPAPVANQPTYTIDVSGGAGSVNGGGSGGSVTFTGETVFAGALSLGVYTTGVATAPSTTPPTVTPAYGATELDVTANLTLATHTQATQAAVGEYYILGNTLYYAKDATNNEVAVTGLHVEPNVTLTLSTGNLNGLANDVVVEGTVALASGQTSLGLSSSRVLVVGANAHLASPGTSVAGSNGGAAPTVNLQGTTVIEQAAIDVSGGAADATHSGGNSGGINIGGQAVWITGALTSNGANGGTGVTGGGYINVSFVQSAVVTGAITMKGGTPLVDGISAGGGGTFSANANPEGQYRPYLVSTGAFELSGGNGFATGTGATSGGSGGAFNIGSAVGGWTNTGDVHAVGGIGYGTGNGGNGGRVNFNCSQGFNGSVPGNSQISGNMALGGGAGASGGSGGSFNFYSYTETNQGTVAMSTSAQLLGYATISTNGGDGKTGGGSAGGANFTSYQEYTSYGTQTIVVSSALTANGGKATTSGNGGNGGSFNAFTGVYSYGGAVEGVTAIISTSGAVSCNGGDGVSGGNAGSVNINGGGGLANSGAITLKAGNGSAGNGGSAGGATLQSGGAVANSGAIVSQGGNAAGAGFNGGSGGNINLNGPIGLTNTAALTSTGGNSAAATGGNGGGITATGSPFSNTGAATSTGGTGSTANGTAGVVNLNGVTQ